MKCKMGKIADKRLTTEDIVGYLVVRWIQGVRRWRRIRRIKQKDICHFPELVILHSLLFMWMTGKGIICLLFFFFFVLIFLEDGDPRALPAAMVLYVRGGKKLSC